MITECVKRRLNSLGHRVQVDNLVNFFKESAGSIIGEVYFGYNLDTERVDGVPFTIYLSDTIAFLSKLSYSPLYCATNLTFNQTGAICVTQGGI